MVVAGLWLRQVSIGAFLSDAEPATCVALRDKVRRLDELGMQRRPGRSPRPEDLMTAYKFSTGQEVFYHPPRRSPLAVSLFTVLKRLPVEDGERKYRIKAAQENFERVAKESELTRSS